MSNKVPWSIWDGYNASRDGWTIDRAGRVVRITGPLAIFNTDAEAEAYVVARAAAGSDLHERAVAYAAYSRLTS